MHRGFLKFYRKSKDSTFWWKLPALEYRGAWLTLLLRANYTPGTFNGVTIPAGSFATSLANLATEFGCGVHKLRDILDFFEKHGMITTKNMANRFTLITICNWAIYNGSGDDSGREKADRREDRGTTAGASEGTDRRKTKKRRTSRSDVGNQKSSGKKCFKRPTLAEIEAYKSEIGYDSLDAQHFLDTNDATGWVKGRNNAPIKEWKAHVRCWRRLERQVPQTESLRANLLKQLEELH